MFRVLTLFTLFTSILCQTFPLFLWSNDNFFHGSNNQILEGVSTHQVSEILGNIRQPNPLASYVSKTRNPEIIVAFLNNDLSREQFSVVANAYSSQHNGGSFAHLKSSVETSSSIVLPYTFGSGLSLVEDLAAVLSSSASIIVASQDGSQTIGLRGSSSISFQQMEESLSSGWDILKNGRTDLLVVFTSAQNDNMIARVEGALKNTNYLAVFALGSGAETMELPSSDPILRNFEERFIQANLEASDDDKWIIGEISQALIVMIPFLAVLGTGISCTRSLQSNLKFGLEKQNFKTK